MDPLTEAQLEDIRRDVTAFADPGTKPMVEPGMLIWEKDGSDHEAELLQGTNEPSVKIGDVRMPYGRFLASHHMADLRQLAEFMVKTMHPLEDPYTPTPAFHSETENGPADSVIAESTRELPHGSTRIVFVQGEAGSGKTVTLRHMARKRAAEYDPSTGHPLFFYIDVQGRALSRLDDAMARDLQNLRSRFPYNAVPSLVRNRLLVPIIDGFDELLGAGGYDEAFSSLAALVSQLNGRGAIVASARATFFDYKGFRENAERFARDDGLSYEIFPVRVDPWDDETAESFVRKKSQDRAIVRKFAELRDQMDGSDLELLRKPFYVAQITKLLIEPGVPGVDKASGRSVLDGLVQAFVRREMDKLLSAEGQPLLRFDQHYDVLGRLAEEMWWVETRQLDIETVQTVAELFCEEVGLSADEARHVQERIVTHAMLQTTELLTSARRFEHDVFFSFFLATRLKTYVSSDRRELRRFLRRSVLDDVSVECLVRMYNNNTQEASNAATAICSAVTTGMVDAVSRENGGRLVAELIRNCDGLRPGMEIRNLYFHGSHFGKVTLKNPVFRRCHFIGADFTETRMEKPRFVDCDFQVPTVDLETTRFDGAGPEMASAITGIAVSHNGESREYYAPSEIKKFLEEMGVAVAPPPDEFGYTDAQKRRIALMDKFVYKMERRYHVATERFESLLPASAEWGSLRDLLRKHELLEEIPKPKGSVIRLAYPPDIIRRGEDLTDPSRPQLTAFWVELLDDGQ